jgi:hypothetical protein
MTASFYSGRNSRHPIPALPGRLLARGALQQIPEIADLEVSWLAAEHGLDGEFELSIETGAGG